jgi:hypothetical protein
MYGQMNFRQYFQYLVSDLSVIQCKSCEHSAVGVFSSFLKIGIRMAILLLRTQIKCVYACTVLAVIFAKHRASWQSLCATTSYRNVVAGIRWNEIVWISEAKTVWNSSDQIKLNNKCIRNVGCGYNARKYSCKKFSGLVWGSRLKDSFLCLFASSRKAEFSVRKHYLFLRDCLYESGRNKTWRICTRWINTVITKSLQNASGEPPPPLSPSTFPTFYSCDFFELNSDDGGWIYCTGPHPTFGPCSSTFFWPDAKDHWHWFVHWGNMSWVGNTRRPFLFLPCPLFSFDLYSPRLVFLYACVTLSSCR